MFHTAGWGALYLDAHRLVVQVYGGADWTGPGVEVKEGSSCQSEEGDDGRSRERGEEELEEEIHGAGRKDNKDLAATKGHQCVNKTGSSYRTELLNYAPDIIFRRPKST